MSYLFPNHNTLISHAKLAETVKLHSASFKENIIEVFTCVYSHAVANQSVWIHREGKIV